MDKLPSKVHTEKPLELKQWVEKVSRILNYQVQPRIIAGDGVKIEFDAEGNLVISRTP